MIAAMGADPIYTLGHGDRSIGEFLDCIRSVSARTVADVRSYPASRRQPWFTRENLEPALLAGGVSYRWLGRELGGLRTAGYEAHMESEAFAEGLARIEALADEGVTVLVCAERDPALCHRRHIARALRERGIDVLHLMEPGRTLLPGEGPEDQGTLFPI